ncbi:MAG TPA: cytochrome c maturation protein CcmE [Acidimicrobiia bacterium]|nr:cytochrome c maturation protein CcmE [Acidimicrobiia bacterium]
MTTLAAPPAPPPTPQRPRNRTRYVVAVGGCVFAVLAIIVLAVVLSQNVMYFRTVTEAVHNRADEGTSRFRLAGAVVDGTVHATATGVRFEITDGKHTVTVDHTGDPPDLFKEGAPVVCEGHWASTARSAPFDSDRILIKHGSDYEPPKVDTSKRSTQ